MSRVVTARVHRLLLVEMLQDGRVATEISSVTADDPAARKRIHAELQAERLLDSRRDVRLLAEIDA